MEKENDYCQCEEVKTVYFSEGEWGYWDMCFTYNKPIEDGFHYYSEDELEY